MMGTIRFEDIDTFYKGIEKIKKVRDNTNDPKLKESIKKKIVILKGDKTVRK